MAELSKKQERETRLHFLDTRIDTSTGTAVVTQIGHDNTDMSRSLTWNTTSEKVVTGVVSATSTRGEETLTVEPFYCREGEPTAELLQHIDKNELELDDIKRYYYEAKINGEGTTIYAFKKLADVKPTGFGGAAENADAIPFELAFSGKKIAQTFDFATMKFADVPPTP